MRSAPLLATAGFAAAGLAAVLSSTGPATAGRVPAAAALPSARAAVVSSTGPAAAGQVPAAAALASTAPAATRPPRPATLQLPPVTPFQAARTERMLRHRIACLGCHRIRGEGGRIGPSLEGLADRATAEYVLEVIRDPAAVLPGTTMPHQPMPERDAERLAAYLLAPPPVGAPSTPPAPDVQPQAPPALPEGRENDGAALYARHCAACHGPRGAGDGWNAPALPVPPTAHADSALMSARPDDSLYDAIAGGAWVLDGSPMMPPFGRMLTPTQIRALVRHIRTLCRCEGPAWSRDGAER